MFQLWVKNDTRENFELFAFLKKKKTHKGNIWSPLYSHLLPGYCFSHPISAHYFSNPFVIILFSKSTKELLVNNWYWNMTSDGDFVWGFIFLSLKKWRNMIKKADWCILNGLAIANWQLPFLINSHGTVTRNARSGANQKKAWGNKGGLVYKEHLSFVYAKYTLSTAKYTHQWSVWWLLSTEHPWILHP